MCEVIVLVQIEQNKLERQIYELCYTNVKLIQLVQQDESKVVYEIKTRIFILVRIYSIYVGNCL